MHMDSLKVIAGIRYHAERIEYYTKLFTESKDARTQDRALKNVTSHKAKCVALSLQYNEHIKNLFFSVYGEEIGNYQQLLSQEVKHG